MDEVLNDIHYRKATRKDVNILATYRVMFLNEVLNTEKHPFENELKKELIIFFKQSTKEKSVISWVAEYKNEIIATSTLVIWKAPMTYAGLGYKGKRGYVLNMYTLHKYRKKGIAKFLLRKLILEAKKEGLEQISLHATNDGIGIYKDLGFEEPKHPELTLSIKKL